MLAGSSPGSADEASGGSSVRRNRPQQRMVQTLKVVGELVEDLKPTNEQVGCGACRKASQLAATLRKYLLNGVDHEPVALLDTICRLMAIPVESSHLVNGIPSAENSPEKQQSGANRPDEKQLVAEKVLFGDFMATPEGQSTFAKDVTNNKPPSKTRNWLAEDILDEAGSASGTPDAEQRQHKVHSDSSILSYETHTCRCRGVQRREASVQCTRDDIEDITCQVMSTIVTARSVDTARSVTYADWIDPSTEEAESPSQDQASWEAEWQVLDVPRMLGTVLPKLFEPFDFLRNRNMEVIQQAMTPRAKTPRLSARGSKRLKTEEPDESEKDKLTKKIEQMIRRGQTDQEIVAKLRFIRGVTDVSFSRVKEVRRSMMLKDVDLSSQASSPEKDDQEEKAPVAPATDGVLPREVHAKVLKLLLKGKTNAQIAKHFSLAEHNLDEASIQKFRARSHTLNIVSSGVDEGNSGDRRPAPSSQTQFSEPPIKTFTL